MKNLILLLFAVFFLQSCNEKTHKQLDEISDTYSFQSTISVSDKILFRLKKENETEVAREDSCFENVAVFKAEKPNQIKNFESLFENSNYTFYCCCPKTNIAIDFYSNSKKIDTYFVDTTTNRDKVQIFEKSFQFSFFVDKQNWIIFLKDTE